MSKNLSSENPLSEMIRPQENPRNVLTGNETNKITCRICLEESSPNDTNRKKQKFIRPCLCKGTAEYAHEECLIEWLTTVMIKRKIKAEKKRKEQQKGFHCEICKEYISAVVQQELRILTPKQIKERIAQSYSKFLFYIIFQIIFLCVVGGLAYIAYLGLIKETTPVIIGACVLLSLLVVVLAIKMINKFCLKRQKKITNVLQNIYPKKLTKNRQIKNSQKKEVKNEKPFIVIVQTNNNNDISHQPLKQNNQQNAETASTYFGYRV